MAKRAAYFPSWVQTVGAAKAEGAQIKAWCDKCNETRLVDYDRLIAQKGPDYSLINRRSKCACGGWVFFLYRNGVFRPLWDDSAVNRWIS